jgi:hypothetical protein
MLKRNTGFWWIAFGLGVLFDILFWKKPVGISFVIFTGAAIAAGFLLARYQGERPAWRASLLVVPVLFFAGMTFFRMEGFTLLLSIFLALIAMGLLAMSFLGGKWVAYGVPEWVVNWMLLAAGAFGLGASHISQNQKTRVALPPSGRRSWLSGAAPVLRGLLIAVPVIIVFTALLSSADAVFSKQVEDFLDFFDLKRLPEYVTRILMVLSVGWLLGGVYLYALVKSKNEFALDPEKPFAKPFLGATEAVIVLISVNLLFAFFVSIQFRYFFGGQANINIDGFTYSEYARRGFGELLLVAFFSLLLFVGLSAISRRETRGRKLTFSIMGVLLMALVSVILTSGFQRLALYEQAYGFTRLRTYTHVFMIWLGVLLVGVVALEVTAKMRYFMLVSLTAAMGFAATLGIMNVDAFIAARNIERARAGEELDFHYLSTLSPDAVPLMVRQFGEGSNPDEVRHQIGAALACQARELEDSGRMPWQSFHWSRWQAGNTLSPVVPQLEPYKAHKVRSTLYVIMNGEQVECFQPVEGMEER